ncbi:MAG: 5'/3'-nucleotidase SurE, partial [Gemmatales bacterium]|nr:5'/3'-nucleotidase SurE [Gemmatales bacterium]MDW8388144.1 5'/3'-nucleotidase SurE [Gemmatales bacterium]
MRILLTNDDGIYAPGLRALRQELMKLGEVVVVAPATEQSAVGHSITLLTPILVQEVFDGENQRIGWAVE